MATPHIDRTNTQTCINTYSQLETHVYTHIETDIFTHMQSVFPCGASYQYLIKLYEFAY